MAKTETITTPDELKKVSLAAIEQSDRFVLGVSQAHKSLPSDARKKLIKELSLFGFLAPIWRELTTTQKNVWKDAAAYSNLTNWQLFISDNAARIRNGLGLDVPPSDLWQVRAGHIVIDSPATEIILKQEHPLEYFVSQKIPGTPWKNEIVALTETFSLPLALQIRYKSDLSATGPTQSARFYAQVWTSYQGQDIYTDVDVTLSPSTDWTLGTANLAGARGILVGYTLFLEIIGYTGELLFDNISAVHGGTNWARDPRCDDVNKEFKKAFAVVPPFWIPVSLPSGASFVSAFPPALS